MELDKNSRRMRCLVLAIASLLLVLIVTILAMIVAIKVSGQVWSDPAHTIVVDDVLVLGATSGTSSDRTKHHNNYARTPRCFKTCTDFSKPGFNASCENNACRCHGNGYSEDTCLPKFGDCIIERTHSGDSLSVQYSGKSQNVYSCNILTPDQKSSKNNKIVEQRKKSPRRNLGRPEVPKADERVHVISLYGNYRTKFTAVDLRGSSEGPVTLILASSRPVYWSLYLHNSNLNIRKIMLISSHRVSASSVNIHRIYQPLVDEADDAAYPPAPDTVATLLAEAETTVHDPGVAIERQLLKTGYGNDQRGGDTPRFLQTISEIFGKVRTFVGAAHADKILVDLGNV